MATQTERIAQAGSSFRLGDWLVEPSLNRISRGGASVQIERKAMDILVYLAERAGELVDRRELLDAIWQTEFVSYNTIVGRIYELREALEDDARDPRYIETIPKRGYRLIADVSFAPGAGPEPGVLPEMPPEGADERPPSTSSAARPRSRRCGARSRADGCWP
jgi:DNA-binding winged helix-turn-helix (wHTH) protein